MARSTTEIEVTGLAETIRELDKLPHEIAQRIERRELRKATKIIQEEAQRIAPVGETAALVGGIKVRVKRTKRGLILGEIRSTARHSHLIEFGHRLVGHKPRKKRIGSVPAHPFMRPALVSKGEQALRILGDGVQKSMERLAKKGMGKVE